MRRSAALLPILASWALPQTVAAVGKVARVQGPTICMQGETHRLECTSVFLKSTTVNLDDYLGQVAKVSGRDVGIACTVIDVTQAGFPSVTLGWTGDPTPRGTVTFQACIRSPNPPHPFHLFVSLSPGWSPIDPLLGAVLLGFPFVFLCQGYGLFCGTCPVTIPPGTEGITVHAQAVGIGFFAEISNAVCFTIR